MTDDPEKLEAGLGALLRAPERSADEAFVARIECAVRLEERMAAQRRTAWRRFGSEAAAAAAIAVAFLIVGRLAPPTGTVDLISFGPATAAALLLLFWMTVGMRPLGAGR